MTTEEASSARIVQVERLLEERDTLIHDLEVHQAELEAQNQQLRETQHLLEESRARYSDLYDFAPVAYCTLDPSGSVSEINLAGSAMLGRQRGRVIGKPFAIFLSEPDRAVFRLHLQRRMASPEGPMVVELTLDNSLKKPIVIRLVSAVAFDPAGHVVGCRSAFTDITEQRSAEDALRLAVHMREDFLAIVSHDLRNPLNSIMLGSEILKGAPLDTASLAKVDVIHRAAARMSRMLSDLLDLSSMDAGHLSMERRVERVDTLLAAVVEAANSGAVARGIRVETVLDDPDMVAYCDRDRITQVLANLVGNAVKFSSANAQVRIEVKRDGDGLEIAVRDSGSGISKAQLEHIFDPYWQVAKTAKLGTGLGLSIARGIVECHGGRIWVESVVDRGSCFFFTLPAAHVREPTARRRGSGPLSGSHPIVKLQPVAQAKLGPILIVDDEPDVHLLLTDVLRAEGYEVVAASDGAVALRYLRTATVLPCLILLDLVMPNMDGWRFIEERSHDPRLTKIPVVLISGQLAARAAARALGLASYIEKPIAIARVREMLVRVRDGVSASLER